MDKNQEVQDNMDIDNGCNDVNEEADSESITEPKIKKLKTEEENIEINKNLKSENNDSQTKPKVEKKNTDTTTPKREKSVIYDDDSIPVPEGWKRLSVQRMGGLSAGKFDIYYISPLGKRLRSRNEIMGYCEKEGIEIDMDEFIFNQGRTPGRSKKSLDSPAKTTPTTKSLTTPKSTPPLKSTPTQKKSALSKTTPTVAKSKDSPSAVVSSKKSPGKKENIPKSPKKIDEEKKIPKKKTPSFKVSSDGLIRAKLKPQSQALWIPPKSPFNLFQESLFDKPWQLLAGTIILGKSSGGDNVGMEVLNGFLKHFPTPEVTIKANPNDIAESLVSIANKDRIAKILIKFSEEFICKQWTYPKELHGIGKFGNDSYKVFCINEWKKVKSSDYLLNFYVDWLWDNHVILEIE